MSRFEMTARAVALLMTCWCLAACEPESPSEADAGTEDAELPDEGQPIECITDDECEAGLICDAGRCVERQDCPCPAIDMPVCGGDGMTYGNACQAECVGVSVVSDGPCAEGCECPELLDPVCGADGRTYDNPCLAECAGIMIDRPGSCDDVLCGGEAGIACADDAYCAFEAGGCGFDDSPGLCIERPMDCPAVDAPVCACDGTTYDNACRAHAAGFDVQSEGPCDEPCVCADVVEPVCGEDGATQYDNGCLAECAGDPNYTDGPCPVVCGTRGAEMCAEDAWCDYVAGCGADDLGGVCRPRPQGCDDIFAPVCGCDGESYPNACEAASAGVDVERDGDCDVAACTPDECGPQPGLPNFECPDGSIGGPTGRCTRDDADMCGWEIRECPDGPDPVACGARLGDTCAPETFCDFERLGCDFADATGTCRIRPDRCDEIRAPVCGCDGNTYVNACEAHLARTDVAAEGACDAPVEACEPDECGAPPGLPNVECADGTVGGPTGRCLRGRDARCAWEIRPCPEDG